MFSKKKTRKDLFFLIEDQYLYHCCNSYDESFCIECDDCEEWWHRDCLLSSKYGRNEREFETACKEDDKFCCPECMSVMKVNILKS